MRSFIVNKESDSTTEILKIYDGKLSYSALMKLYRNKDVKVNGKRIKESVKVNAGDTISVYYVEKEDLLDKVYEDDNIVVINKKENTEFYDLENRLIKEYGNIYSVHRLDRNTSGLIVFAKNKESGDVLKYAIKVRTLEKYYLAKVFGYMDKASEVLTAYLKKDSENSFVKIYKENVPGAEKIITGYKVIEKLDDGSTIIEVELITGKTHQIRSHMAFVGHPIIGDEKYGKQEINKKYNYKHQCLTAYKLVFHFPKNSVLGYLDGKEVKLKEAGFPLKNN